MSKILVNEIGHNNDTTAMTIDSGGNISEANKEYFHVTLSTRITGVTDNTVNVVNFNSNGIVRHDTKSNWDSTNNAYQFDSADGVYLITYSVGLQSPTVSSETMVDGAASMIFSTDNFSSVVNAPAFGSGMRVLNNVGDELGSVALSGSVIYKNTNANMKVQLRAYANTSGSATYSISEQVNQMVGSTVSDFINSDCTYFSVVRIA